MIEHPNQFEYLGRWVDTKHFCAFVYSKDDQKLAKNYQEFTDLIGSGLWFPSRESALKSAETAILTAESVPLNEENDENSLKMDRKERKNHFRALAKQGK